MLVKTWFHGGAWEPLLPTRLHGLLDFKIRSSVYGTFHMYHFTSILHVLIRTPNVSGFIALLCRASHRYHEVTGSNPVEFLTFSGFSTQLLKCVHTWYVNGLLDFKIRSSIYGTFHIYHLTSILHGLIRTHKWPAPNISGFIAQLVRASHRYREVTHSNPVKSWLFQPSIRNCLNCVHNCGDHGLLDFKIHSSLYGTFHIYHFTSILHGLIGTHKWPAPNVSWFIA